MTASPWEHPQTLVPKMVWTLLHAPRARVLDIGGGSGIVGVPNWPSLFTFMVLDAFPYRPNDEGFTCGNGMDAEAIFGAKSYDIVMMFEVIEHLPKEDGPRLLAAAERVARCLVIGSTPHGFAYQPPLFGNPHQEHLSGWCHTELEPLGYDVHGNGGTFAAQLIFSKVLA